MASPTELASHRKSIKLLPEHLIDQIKAGEVIERPASILKELIENSIDAGSTRIDLQIIDNGLELISIEDNGSGIQYEDMPYAFCRHATSKITSFEDIYRLHSFGFRGEALASMASISRVICSSSPSEDPSKGARIELHGGVEQSLAPFSSTKSGTSIFVKDLFFNTPARLKFIKSKASEKNAIKKIIHSFILTNFHVNFSIRWDDKPKEFFPAIEEGSASTDRIKQIFFKKNSLDTDVISFEHEYEGYAVKGYLSKSSSKGNAGKVQYLFSNNRFFSDRSLHSIIMRKTEGFWSPGETGHYVISISVPASELDVNVHPNKTHIKFFKPSLIFSLLSGALEKTLEKRRTFIPDSMGTEATDLSNFQVSPFSTSWENPNSHSPIVFSDKYLGNTSSSNNEFTILTNRYFLKTTEDGTKYLFDFKNCFTNFFLNSMEDNQDVLEADLIPLLISEPFESQSIPDSVFETIKSYGFEFDRVDAQTIVLRTIPFWAETLPLQVIFNNMISWLEESKLTSVTHPMLIDFFKDNLFTKLELFNTSQIQSILRAFELEDLKESGLCILFDESVIKELFKK